MKKVMYGTVSALALMLAVNGVAMAGDEEGGYYGRDHKTDSTGIAVGTSDSFVGFNSTAFTGIIGSNLIDKEAFQNAIGAFQVLQNESVNSSVGQSMGIAGVLGADADENTTLAFAGGWSGVIANCAIFTGLVGNNLITDDGFQNAAGAFQVQQNQSVNSAVQQDMAIAGVITQPHTDTGFDQNTAVAVSQLSAAVAGNTAFATLDGRLGRPAIEGPNTITDSAFQNAHGAFEVLQNTSVNSAVQQSMAIGVVVNTSVPQALSVLH